MRYEIDLYRNGVVISDTETARARVVPAGAEANALLAMWADFDSKKHGLPDEFRDDLDASFEQFQRFLAQWVR